MHHQFLQSESWQAFQESLGRRTFQRSGNDWRYMAILEAGRGGTRLYVPAGPAVADGEALERALQSLRETARENGAVFARIEPRGDVSPETLQELGLRKSRIHVQPELTWCIDLRQAEADIIAAMRATNRNLHRTAEKKGLTFRKSYRPEDIEHLLRFIHEVAERTGIRPHSDRYFRMQADILLPRKSAVMFIAEFEGYPVAAALAYDDAATRYYAHAGGSHADRKLHAGIPLVTHMFLDAKRSGLSTFDFYGIAPPEQPDHPWAGFTSFKKSFGGYEQRFVGTWELPVKTVQYRLYRAATNVADRIRQ